MMRKKTLAIVMLSVLVLPSIGWAQFPTCPPRSELSPDETIFWKSGRGCTHSTWKCTLNNQHCGPVRCMIPSNPNVKHGYGDRVHVGWCTGALGPKDSGFHRDPPHLDIAGGSNAEGLQACRDGLTTSALDRNPESGPGGAPAAGSGSSTGAPGVGGTKSDDEKVVQALEEAFRRESSQSQELAGILKDPNSEVFKAARNDLGPRGNGDPKKLGRWIASNRPYYIKTFGLKKYFPPGREEMTAARDALFAAFEAEIKSPPRNRFTTSGSPPGSYNQKAMQLKSALSNPRSEVFKAALNDLDSRANGSAAALKEWISTPANKQFYKDTFGLNQYIQMSP